jgi:hypothetical protein
VLTAIRNAEKDERIQVNILLHCVGPKVIEIYDQFTWANAEHILKVKQLFDKIENYCNPRKNEVLESHRFWVTNPDEYTSFDSFLTEF